MIQRRSEAVIGFVIGVLVGLGAALAVAVFVTKVPVPFMTNKSQGRTVTQDAAEAQKNRDWDPNTALLGRNPPRPPVALGNTADTASSPRAPQAAARSDVRADMKVVPSASSDPLGDLARVRASAGAASATPKVAATTSAAPVADPFIYFVQAGAFRTADEAEAQRAKLSLLGVESRVTEREQSGRTVFRVRVGPFDRKDDADRSKERLDGNGLETALVRVQR